VLCSGVEMTFLNSAVFAVLRIDAVLCSVVEMMFLNSAVFTVLRIDALLCSVFDGRYLRRCKNNLICYILSLKHK